MISSANNFCDAKSIFNGGVSMATTRSKAILRSPILASTAMLLGAIFTVLLVPAYGQQEVDPTWYDPTPNTAIAQPAQTARATHASQPPVTVNRKLAVKSAPSASKAAQVRVNDKQLDQSRHHAADKNVGTPAAGNDQPSVVGHLTLEARNAEINR